MSTRALIRLFCILSMTLGVLSNTLSIGLVCSGGGAVGVVDVLGCGLNVEVGSDNQCGNLGNRAVSDAGENIHQDALNEPCPNFQRSVAHMSNGATVTMNGCSSGQFMNIVYRTPDGRSFTDQCAYFGPFCSSTNSVGNGAFFYQCNNAFYTQ
ncbi:hypothetical protein CLCR_07715 [Cladophialophora carrionii]|uniref:Uncharacterized protein n=1 Tax=Cladophialophora carrionii TaxID=86049 RepID=A0A1C1CME1_9EURO|nr:hypothetical protein CLCR_07715 [Cladophialophora carrionii]